MGHNYAASLCVVQDAAYYHICLYRRLSVGHQREPSKTAESIAMPFSAWHRLVEPKERRIGRGAHWRHMANTIEWSVQDCRWPVTALSVASAVASSACRSVMGVRT